MKRVTIALSLLSLVSSTLASCTAAKDPFHMAAKAIAVGNDILKGNKPANSNILILVELITRENVDRHKGWTSE